MEDELSLDLTLVVSLAIIPAVLVVLALCLKIKASKSNPEIYGIEGTVKKKPEDGLNSSNVSDNNKLHDTTEDSNVRTPSYERKLPDIPRDQNDIIYKNSIKEDSSSELYATVDDNVERSYAPQGPSAEEGNLNVTTVVNHHPYAKVKKKKKRPADKSDSVGRGDAGGPSGSGTRHHRKLNENGEEHPYAKVERKKKQGQNGNFSGTSDSASQQPGVEVVDYDEDEDYEEDEEASETETEYETADRLQITSDSRTGGSPRDGGITGGPGMVGAVGTSPGSASASSPRLRGLSGSPVVRQSTPLPPEPPPHHPPPASHHLPHHQHPAAQEQQQQPHHAHNHHHQQQQQHFSGDSQDSMGTKGYTSISVREPLEMIRPPLGHQLATQEGNYMTLSETSDEMYAAIEDNVYMDPEGASRGSLSRSNQSTPGGAVGFDPNLSTLYSKVDKKKKRQQTATSESGYATVNKQGAGGSGLTRGGRVMDGRARGGAASVVSTNSGRGDSQTGVRSGGQGNSSDVDYSGYEVTRVDNWKSRSMDPGYERVSPYATSSRVMHQVAEDNRRTQGSQDEDYDDERDPGYEVLPGERGGSLRGRSFDVRDGGARQRTDNLRGDNRSPRQPGENPEGEGELERRSRILGRRRDPDYEVIKGAGGTGNNKDDDIDEDDDYDIRDPGYETVPHRLRSDSLDPGYETVSGASRRNTTRPNPGYEVVMGHDRLAGSANSANAAAGQLNPPRVANSSPSLNSQVSPSTQGFRRNDASRQSGSPSPLTATRPSVASVNRRPSPTTFATGAADPGYESVAPSGLRHNSSKNSGGGSHNNSFSQPPTRSLSPMMIAGTSSMNNSSTSPVPSMSGVMASGGGGSGVAPPLPPHPHLYHPHHHTSHSPHSFGSSLPTSIGARTGPRAAPPAPTPPRSASTSPSQVKSAAAAGSSPAERQGDATGVRGDARSRMFGGRNSEPSLSRTEDEPSVGYQPLGPRGGQPRASGRNKGRPREDEEEEEGYETIPSSVPKNLDSSSPDSDAFYEELPDTAAIAAANLPAPSAARVPATGSEDAARPETYPSGSSYGGNNSLVRLEAGGVGATRIDRDDINYIDEDVEDYLETRKIDLHEAEAGLVPGSQEDPEHPSGSNQNSLIHMSVVDTSEGVRRSSVVVIERYDIDDKEGMEVDTHVFV